MKIRDLDLSNNPINQEHQHLGLPPIEQIPEHPIIRTAVWFAALSMLGLLTLRAFQLFGNSWNEGIKTIENTLNDSMFWNALMVELVAQIVDGALGMAYGLTSTSFLLATGTSPALASASVHMAELFTTGISGITHAKFGNVDKKLFIRLLIPGIIGGILGALLVTQIDGDSTKTLLMLVGTLIIGISIFNLMKIFFN